MTQNLSTLRTMKRRAEEAIQSYGRTALRAEFRAFFDAHPEVLAIRWTQYTPYFNDGEPCEFSVQNFEYRLTDEAEARRREAASGDDDPDAAEDEDDDEEEFIDSRGLPHPDAADAFERNVSDDEILRVVFGDHCRVRADRTGFSVEEYEHE